MKKKQMRRSIGDAIFESKTGMLIVSVITVIFGIFFIVSQNENKPIPRSEALSYSGDFEKYEAWNDNYRTIYFTDGSTYSVYPHTETMDFQKKMKALDKGTKLFLLVNPNNDCVVEIKTETEELLNFETSQAEIDSYDNGYIILGGFVCVAGVFGLIYAILFALNQRKEADRNAKKKKNRLEGKGDKAIRRAKHLNKCKILLEAEISKYNICYRRVKNVNELVVNGIVYDEIKGVIEFEHNLSAVIDSHTIEAGYDNDSFSYILFDGERIAEKKRWI